MKKALLASALMTLVVPVCMAAGPVGFGNSPNNHSQPQGFSLNPMNDIATLKKNAYDDQLVTIKGRFTKQLTKDKFELLLGENLKGRKEFIESDGYRYLDLADLS